MLTFPDLNYVMTTNPTICFSIMKGGTYPELRRKMTDIVRSSLLLI